jgi:hypothetical protein
LKNSEAPQSLPKPLRQKSLRRNKRVQYSIYAGDKADSLAAHNSHFTAATVPLWREIGTSLHTGLRLHPEILRLDKFGWMKGGRKGIRRLKIRPEGGNISKPSQAASPQPSSDGLGVRF